MLDSLLSELEDEVALEGENGCNLEQLWSFVQVIGEKHCLNAQTTTRQTFTLDEKYKTFLWTFIKALPFVFKTELDINESLNLSDLSFDQAIIRHGSNLRIVAQSEKQKSVLLHGQKLGQKSFKDIQYSILKAIARARHGGITQNELTVSFSMDARTVFHHLKVLQEACLISKQPSVHKGTYTNTCVHARFVGPTSRETAKSNQSEEVSETLGMLHHEGSIRRDAIQKKLTDMLLKAPDNMMALQDIVNILGLKSERQIRWARAYITRLHEEGFLEKIKVVNDKARVHCVRLLKKSKESATQARERKPLDVQAYLRQPGPLSIAAGIAVERVIYNHITTAGEQGLSRQDIIDRMTGVDERIILKFCDRARFETPEPGLKRFEIFHITEASGRERRYRYFSREGWERYQVAHGGMVEDPPQDKLEKEYEVEEPISIFHHIIQSQQTDRNLQTDKASDTKDRGRKKKHLPEESVSKNNTLKRAKRSKITHTKEATLKETGDEKVHIHIPTHDNVEASIEDMCSSETDLESRLDPSQNTRRLNLSDSVDIPDIEEQQTISATMPVKRAHEVDVEDFGKTNTATVMDDDMGNSSGSSRSKKTRRLETPGTATNVTHEERKKRLMSIIQRDRIRTVGHLLLNEMQTLECEAGSKHQLARRTLQRLAESLATSGILKSIKLGVPTFAGRTELKTIVMSPHLSTDDAEVQRFLTDLRTEKMMANTSLTHRTLTELQGNVQRVAIHDLQQNHANFNDEITNTNQFWRYTAQRHGWNTSKWIRARLWHHYLFQKMQNGSKEERESRIVVMADMVNSLPLDLYCKVFGIFGYNEQVERFMETNTHPEITLRDLPDNLKMAIIQHRRRLRRLLVSSMDILEALQVIEPIKDPDQQPRTVAARYRLLTVGRIRNYATPERPMVQECPLVEYDDITLYWNELQFICTCAHRLPPEQFHKNTKDPLNSICLARTWEHGVVLTLSQKRILDAHVNHYEGQAPVHDDELILQLSRKTSLLPERIKQYFERIIQLHQTRVSLKKTPVLKKRNPKDLQSKKIAELIQESVENRSTSLVATHLKRQVFSIEPTFMGSRDSRRLRIHSTDFKAAVPPPKKHRPLTEVEQDVILHAMVIMRHRARDHRFYWNPLARVLGNMSADDCRKRFASLKKKNPAIEDQIEVLINKWAMFFKQGIASKAITDENPLDIQDYDLATLLQYFFTRLKDEKSPEKIWLPRDYETIIRMYTVTPEKSPEKLLTGRSTAIYANILDQFDGTGVPTTMTTEHYLISILVKMMLVTREEVYKPSLAFSLLRVYGARSVEHVTNFMKENGMIIHTKLGYSKRIPGRQFNVSEKFLNTMAGPYSSTLCKDAMSCYRGIASHQSVPPSPNKGDMACILSLLSENKVKIVQMDSEKFLKTKQELVYPKSRFTTLMQIWLNKGVELIFHLDEPLPEIQEEHQQQDIMMKVHIGFEGQLEPLKNINSEQKRVVYDMLLQFEERGATLMELKNALNAKRAGINDSEILLSVKELENLIPPLILEVGFSQRRVVATKHAEKWLIKATEEETGVYYQPRLWCDIQGKLVPEALQGCSEAILGHIILQPGISEKNLYAKFTHFLTLLELRDVLDGLLHKNAIFSRTFKQHQRTTLFSKSPAACLSIDITKTIADPQITFYWSSTDFFTKL